MVDKIKALLITASIAVLFSLFASYLVSEIYDQPEYDQFCHPFGPQKEPVSKAACNATGGHWQGHPSQRCLGLCSYHLNISASDCAQVGGSGSCDLHEVLYQDECLSRQGSWSSQGFCTDQGYCEQDFVCRTSYEDTNQHYRRNVFLTGVPLGVIAIFAGMLLTIPVIGSGFIAGGIITVLVSSLPYWGDLGKWLRIMLLFISLLILLAISYKKFK